MNSELKQDLTIVVLSAVLGLLAVLLLCTFAGCTHVPVVAVETSALSGHLSKAQSSVENAESYVDYADNKAVIIRNLLK